MGDEEIAQWTATFAGVSALGAILTAIIAVFTILRAAKDSHERTRPIVVPYAQIGPGFNHGALYLVVKNFGATTARNIDVSFDPPLPEIDQGGNSQPTRDSAAVNLKLRYKAPIQVLAPGQKLVNIWSNRAVENEEREARDRYEKRTAKGLAAGSKPVDPPLASEELTVTVRYEDRTRKKWPGFFRGPRVYTEKVELRMQDYDYETKQNPGDGNDSSVRRAKAIEAVAWELWS